MVMRPGLPNALPLRNIRGARPFSVFVRQVNPDPPPTRWEFYKENLQSGIWDSYRKGFNRYMEMLKENPLTAAGIVAISSGLGVVLTAFHRHNQVIEASFLLGMLAYPISCVIRQFPKMEEAYEMVRDGEPTRGKARFKKALDESMYRIGHVCLKPLTLAAMVAMVLRAPANVRRIYAGEAMFSKFLKPVLAFMKITDQIAPLRFIDRFFRPLERFGIASENVLSKATFGLFKAAGP